MPRAVLDPVSAHVALQTVLQCSHRAAAASEPPPTVERACSQDLANESHIQGGKVPE